MIFEAALTPNPVEAVADLLRQNPQMRIVVVTPGADEELTLELFRRGAHGIVSREVEPELLVDACARWLAGTPGSTARVSLGDGGVSATRTAGRRERVPRCNSRRRKR